MPITYDINQFSLKVQVFFGKLSEEFQRLRFDQRISKDLVAEFTKLVEEFEKNLAEYKENSKQEDPAEYENNKQILNCSPLIHLAKFNIASEQFLEILKEHNANFGLVDYEWNNTALTWALANASNEFAYEFLSFSRNNKLDININHKSFDRENTALHIAIAKAYVSKDSDDRALEVPNHAIVTKLIGCGADPNISNQDKLSALDIAVARRDLSVIYSIINACSIETIEKARGTLQVNFTDSQKIVANVLFGEGDLFLPMDESLFNADVTKRITEIFDKRVQSINAKPLGNPQGESLNRQPIKTADI